jgi:uncharacterized protein YndB with AHSA1/START domain
MIPDLGFTLEETYAAAPERVYACFTDPELLVGWFCPNPDLPTTAEVDVRPGGAWRVRMGDWVVGGSYLEVEPPRRLVFTFDWEHDDDPATTVEVEITPDGSGSRVVLADEETGDDSGHQEGWMLTLARLDQLLS